MERDLRHHIIDAATLGILGILKRFPDGLMTRSCKLLDFGLPLEDLPSSQELKTTLDLINNGYTPIVALNHQSHADILPMAVISRLIMENISMGTLSGFYLPYAASAESGHQGNVIHDFFYALKPWLLDHGVSLISVVREKDRIKYGMNTSTAKNSEELYRSPEKHMGILIVPEGTVEGGRKDADGNIIGMVKAEQGLGRIVNFFIKRNKSFFVLPVGINGTFKLLNPNTLRPTVEAFKALLKPTNLAAISIGMPLMSDDIRAQIKGDKGDYNLINSFIMHHIAALVPSEAQGIYRIR